LKNTLSKTLKYGILILGIVVITVIGLIGFGLWSMEIEDHYGDAQSLYYELENGDLIVNENTSQIGIVEKNWKRINIRTQQIDSTDLYNWIYQNGIETKSKVYRPKTNENDLNAMITDFKSNNENFELVIQN